MSVGLQKNHQAGEGDPERAPCRDRCRRAPMTRPTSGWRDRNRLAGGVLATPALALAAVAAAALSFWLAFRSDHVNEPGLQAALMAWVTLPYIFGGLIAWRRRPDS